MFANSNQQRFDILQERIMDLIKNVICIHLKEETGVGFVLKIINILYQNLQLEEDRIQMSSSSICSVDDTFQEQQNFLSSKMKKISQIKLPKSFISQLSSIQPEMNPHIQKQQFEHIQEETLKASNHTPKQRRNLKQSRNQKKSQNYSLYSSYKLQQHTQKPKESSEKKLRFRQFREKIQGYPISNLSSKQKVIEDIHDLNGRGILQTPDGRVLIGQWINGNMIGLARIIYPSKQIYQGPVNYKHQKQGYGILTFQNGDRYEGSFHLGKFHGEGKVITSKGEILKEGTWNNGRFLRNGKQISI